MLIGSLTVNFYWIDPQLLSLLALVTIVMFIAVKAYIIGVVWNCYKYLMLRNSVIRTVIAYRHDDPTNLMGLQQNLLPDLPDYDTAVNDPRYAKKPPMDANATSSSTSVNHNSNGNAIVSASTISVPPPPYSVAVAAEPLTYNFQVPSQDELATPKQEQDESSSAIITQNTGTVVIDPSTSASAPSPTVATQPIETHSAVQVIEVAPAVESVPQK